MSEDVKELQTAVFGDDEQQIPGLKKEVSEMTVSLNGNGHGMGIIQRVAIMWKLHMLVLTIGGGAIGSLITLIVQRIVKGLTI